jgi:UDP-N-acetylmuramyl pentapeptide phosphotransferase/UDP-N-acetylglucosamine-1-phosphate transferase
MLIDPTPLTNGGITTFFVCVAIVLSGAVHGKLTFDHREGPQKLHVHPTPRVGGVALLIGLVVVFAYAPIPVRELLKPMVIGALPAFLLGLAEDLSRRVRWQERLMGTICSGILIWWLTGVTVSRLDLPGVDLLFLTVPALAVLFTAFAVGGLCNAFNMVDGVHGLSSGLALIALVALGFIAQQHNDVVLAQLSFSIAAVVLGFLLVNFPAGKLFLGDGGAYLIGFMVAWVAILLPFRNASVSPWASLLICSYPVFEAVFSMLRRRARAHLPAHPDALHLHSLLRARLTRRLRGYFNLDLQNALVSPIIWLFALLCAVGAVTASHHTPSLVAMTMLAAMGYLFVYYSVIGFARRMARHRSA